MWWIIAISVILWIIGSYSNKNKTAESEAKKKSIKNLNNDDTSFGNLKFMYDENVEDPEGVGKIIGERKNLENELKLGVTMYQLMDTLRFNKNWDKNGSQPWIFKSIIKDNVEIGRNVFCEDTNKEERVTVYSFEYKNNKYFVQLFESDRGCVLPDGEVYNYKILEVKRQEKLIFRSRISFDYDKYGCGVEENLSSHVEAFIPTDGWYKYILDRAELIHKEDKQYQKTKRESDVAAKKKYFIE